MNFAASEHLLIFTVFAPLAAFILFAVQWLLGGQPSERAVTRASALVFTSCLVAVIILAIRMNGTGWVPVEADLGIWFEVNRYSFPLTLFADGLSLPLLGLTTCLAGLIGSFSRRYLHRDEGFLRFFLLLFLFAFGVALAFSAGSIDLLVGGWELVGLTSVLLIAFFNQRQGPVRNALRTFGIYKIADLGLLLGVFVLHHAAGSASCRALFRGEWPAQSTVLSPDAATLAGLLLLAAAAGKSAQLPFSSWLPRAMEGPTPSSAIFYGAISVHLGVYLLLRCEAILLSSPIAAGATIVVGLLTAIHGTMCSRVAPDAKTALAYAAMAQLGVIFMEAGLGFERLALVHVLGHAVLRTLQFLRAPSALHDYHRLHAAAGGHIGRTGVHYHSIIPAGLRLRLYHFAIERGYLDTLIDRAVVGPCVRLARTLLGYNDRPPKPAGSSARVPGLIGEVDA
jgi:NADH-quinone oxidoreductase subunit L